MTSIFLSILATSFYQHLIRAVATNFTTFIQAEQRVDDGLKIEKNLQLQQTPSPNQAKYFDKA